MTNWCGAWNRGHPFSTLTDATPRSKRWSGIRLWFHLLVQFFFVVGTLYVHCWCAASHYYYFMVEERDRDDGFDGFDF